MNSAKSIDVLRHQFTEAQSGTLGDEMMAFMELASHPELQWADLLNGLSRPGMIQEDAALRLHKLLRVQREGIRVNTDRRFWEDVMAKVGINPSDRIA
jgi:hypothetical protein